MNRANRGCVQINGKKHLVYEGLNVIGRNKDATIILPDASVSHNQCIIVVAKGCHYIGDTKSRNGTFLNDLKLSPFELYDLNMGSSIKFGSLIGIYSKVNQSGHDVTDGTDTEVAIPENVFEAATQVCEGLHNNTSDISRFGTSCNETVVVDVVEGGGINELPTQIITLNCDIGTEVNVTTDTVISVHDMPTQILAVAQDSLVANDSLVVSDQHESKISSDIIEETFNDCDGDDDDKIEETTRKEKQKNEVDMTEKEEEEEEENDDENSRESIDFATMQPAATQSWLFSDSQNMLQKNVLQLKNRIKYVIMSDEDSTPPIVEGDDDSAPTVGDSSDTDIDIGGGPSSSNNKRKKLTKVKKKKKKVPTIKSDSDTDVEQEEIDKSAKQSSPPPVIKTLPTKGPIVNSDSDTDVESANVVGEGDKLDDSDIIPTSQQVPIGRQSYSQLLKDRSNAVAAAVAASAVSANTKNFEASLADSFQLILTDESNATELKEEESNNAAIVAVPIVEKQDAAIEEHKEEHAIVNAFEKDSSSKDDLDNTQNEIQVAFDNDDSGVSPPGLKEQNRPRNPLVDIFNAEDVDGNENKVEKKKEIGGEERKIPEKEIQREPSAYDSIEDNLAKMFAPTQDVVAAAHDKTGKENIFDLVTQKIDESPALIIDRDVFVKPTLPSTTKSIKDVVNDDDDDEDDLFLQPTQILQPDGEDIFSMPTQMCVVNSDTKLDRRKEDEDEDDSAILLQPSQIITEDVTPSIGKNLGKVTEEIEPSLSKTKDDKNEVCRPEFVKPRPPPVTKVTKIIDDDRDEIFLQPTQILQPDGEDIFSMPTQMCVVNSDTKFENQKIVVDDEDDSAIFLQPTQIITADVTPSIGKNDVNEVTEKMEPSTNKIKDGKGAKVIKKIDRDRDDIFLQPTQILPPADGAEIDKVDDIFSMPTQQISGGDSSNTKLDQRKDEEDDDDEEIFFQPTQIIIASIEKNLDEVAEKTESSTSKTKDGESETYKDEIAAKPKRGTKVPKNIDTDRDDIFLQPTPILPSADGDEIGNKVDDIFSMPTQQICVGDSSNTKLDRRKDEDATDIFLQPTQLLSSTDETDVTPYDNKIEDVKENSKAKEEALISKYLEKNARTHANDIFSEPTQILDNAIESNVNLEEEDDKRSKREEREKTATDVDHAAIFIQPTIQLSEVDRGKVEIKSNVVDKEENKGGDTDSAISDEPVVILINEVDKVNVDDSTPTLRIDEQMEDKSKVEETDELKPIDSVSNLRDPVAKTDQSRRRGTRKTKLVNVVSSQDEDDDDDVVEAAAAAKKPRRTETTKAQSKVENPLNRRRRSTRKKSTDEEKNGVVEKSNDLYVIEEINSPIDENVKPSTSTESTTIRRGKRTSKRILSSSSSSTINSPIRNESMDDDKEKPPNKRARKGRTKHDDTIPISPPSTSNNNNNNSSEDHSVSAVSETVTRRIPTRNSKRVAASPTPTTSKTVKEVVVFVDNENNRNSDDDFVIATTTAPTKKVEKKLKEETPKKKKAVAAARLTRKMTEIHEEEEANTPPNESNKDRLSSNTTSTDNYSTSRLTRNKVESTSLSEDDFQENKRQRKPPPTTPRKVIATSVRSSSTSLTTPERNKRKLKPKIVFTMLESPQLETIIRSLGGMIVDCLETSTVLVTGSVKRSQKLLSAVGQSKPICSPKWLQESKKANTFLDPWEYILKDDEAEEKWKFSLSESLRRSAERKLFENFTFQLLVTSGAQDVLKGSIESCGGKCVNRAPAKDAYGNFVIVANPENRSKFARFLKQTPRPKIVAPEAIFDGVLRQELHFDDHALS